MKSKFTRINRCSFWALLFVFSTMQTAVAQGFFRPTVHTRYTFNNRYTFLPDGYIMKGVATEGNSSTGPGVVFHFGEAHLDATGAELSWDSTSLTNPNNLTWMNWLPDDDVLEFTPSAGTSNDWVVNKRHLNGDIVWSYSETSDFEYQSSGSIGSAANESGDVFMECTEENNWEQGGAIQMNLYKFDVNGNLLWSSHEPLPDSASLSFIRLIPMPDRGLLYSYTYGVHRSILNRVSENGQLIWSDTIAESLGYIAINSQEEIYSTLSIYSDFSDTTTTYLEKRSASGQLIWSNNLNALFHKNDVTVSSIVTASNGDILAIEHESDVINGPGKKYLLRFDPEGNLRWKRHYSFLDDNSGGITGATATPDNGFILQGILPPVYDLFLLRIDPNGNVYPGQISGQLAIDDNVTCLIDASEESLANWKIQLQSPNYTLYAHSDSSGHYELQDVPGDDYVLSALPTSNLWESCAGDIQMAIPDTGSLFINQDFPIQSVTDCPFMTLDISTPILRRCFTNSYYVHYCNEGTIGADSAYVQIELHPLLQFNSASIPHTQIGNTLYFPLGAVASLECGDFNFNVTVNCDSTEIGQTLCVSASIFPDTICNPPSNWSGALIEGTGECLGDSIRFQLRNIGSGPTSAGLNSYVVDEHVIMFQQPIPVLPPGGTHTVTVAADGSTWRLIAEQEPNAPGMEMPSIGVEGCGEGGPSFWGFLLQFANRDGNPFSDRDCHEVVGAYDPNDKQAFPIGVAEEHFIEANQPLDYQIRFQNTGTDTAFTVVVKDTLSTWLDPATIRPGAASHPYTWALSGTGILTFTFEHILLPDSNINEAASHGFIQFSIDQHKDLTPGTLLENRAGIYFDFNDPVMTNTVFHTIEKDFLPTGNHEPTAATGTLHIGPNPASEATTIWSEKAFKPGQKVLLRNALGQLVRELPVLGSSVELVRSGLPSGIYFAEWIDSQAVLGAGKVIWK